MNAKKTFLIVVIIVIAGVLAWKYMHPKQAVTELTPSSGISTPTSSVAGAVLNTKGDFELKRDTDYVTISAVFPSKTLLASAADTKVRAAIEGWVNERVTEFQNDTNEMLSAEEQARLKENGQQYAMGIDYKTYTSPGYVSYAFLIYEDTGGAHPNSYSATMTFDTNGNKVELADLFKDGSRYLDRLSAASYKIVLAELKKRAGSDLDETQIDTVRMGTAPSPEALQFFYLDSGNLVLMFPPYQVAAYAAGAFEARVPLADLKDILK